MPLTKRQKILVAQGKSALTEEVIDEFVEDETMRALLQYACRERPFVRHIAIRPRAGLLNPEGDYIGDEAADVLDGVLQHFNLELSRGSSFPGDIMYGDQL